MAAVGPQSGQPSADFAALYQGRFSDLAGQLYAFTGDRSETHDLVQEAFTRAWQRWDTVGRYEDPVAWVRRVAWNLALSRLRRLRVVRRANARLQEPSNVAAAGPDRVALISALRRIPPGRTSRDRAALPGRPVRRRHRGGTGVPTGTVKSWLHRGRVELARHLDDTREWGRDDRA
jgi:RNA polymerase sigma-70 factor, ECF subfamily